MQYPLPDDLSNAQNDLSTDTFTDTIGDNAGPSHHVLLRAYGTFERY